MFESLEAQKTHYESYIASRDDWQFAGIYYDEGTSGTGKARRPELGRLMQDYTAGKIDMVITKSISRFSRNTTDWLQKELIRKANNKQDYDAIANEIFRLRDQKSQAEADTRSREETQKRIAELQDFIQKQNTDITEFNESLVRKLIKQITVYNDHFTIYFKSGLEIDINE